MPEEEPRPASTAHHGEHMTVSEAPQVLAWPTVTWEKPRAGRAKGQV